MSGITPNAGTGRRSSAPGVLGRGLQAAVVLVISATSALVLSLILVIVVAAVPCGGDGGSPFAAEASAQGRTCAFLDDTWVPLLAAIGIAGLAIVMVAMVNWVRTAQRGSRAMRLAACLPLIPVVLAILAFALFAALPDSCSADRAPDDPACESY